MEFIAVTRSSFSIALVALALLGTGCRHPAYIVAEYGEFALTRPSGGTSYTEFSVHLESAKAIAPEIEVVLSDGKSFRCDQLTEEKAKTIFASIDPFESRTGEVVIQHTHCEHDEASAFFERGRLTSLALFEGAKFRKVGQTEFVTLPVEEKEMLRVFGKPKEFSPVYPKKWVQTDFRRIDPEVRDLGVIALIAVSQRRVERLSLATPAGGNWHPTCHGFPP